MNTEKLELKHLAAYLPYNVGVIFNDKIKGVLTGVDPSKLLLDLKVLEEFDNVTPIYKKWSSLDTKLFLRPLSELTETITHNGQSFIPIVELAKIAEKDNFEARTVCVSKNDTVYGCAWNDLKEYTYAFIYDTEAEAFFLKSDPHKELIVARQNKLFQALHEWHFDLYDLLSSNLALPLKD